MDKKSIISKLQRKSDKFVFGARELSSRGSSFLIALLGVLLQAAHTTLLSFQTSSMPDFWSKLIISVGLGIFICSSLLVFTIKNTGAEEYIKKAILIYFWFEVYSNVFYYLNHFVFQNITIVDGEFVNVTTFQDYIFLLIGIPFGIIVPYTIKAFANVIRASVQLDMGSIEQIEDEIKEISEDYKDTLIKEMEEKFKTILTENLREYSDNIEIDKAEFREIIKASEESYEKINSLIKTTEANQSIASEEITKAIKTDIEESLEKIKSNLKIVNENIKKTSDTFNTKIEEINTTIKEKCLLKNSTVNLRSGEKTTSVVIE